MSNLSAEPSRTRFTEVLPIGRRDDAVSWFEVLLLVVAPAVALGDISAGSYCVAGVTALFAVARIVRHRRFDSIDLLVALVVLIILLSPLWVQSPIPSPTASKSAMGAAAGVLYSLPVRWTLRSRPAFIAYIRWLVAITTVFAVIVLVLGADVGVGTGYRIFVDFANPNYVGAVLAFGTVATLWIGCFEVGGGFVRWMYVFMGAIQLIGIYESGSRASITGVLLAVIAVLFGRSHARGALVLAFGSMVAGFFVGFFPIIASTLFRALSQPLEGLATFSRDASAIQTASGREGIWTVANEVVSHSWLVGWGPGRYVDQESAYNDLAHGWGIEFMASVGIVGTIPIAALIARCYLAGLRERAPARWERWALWNAVTALALLPNLVLSTHQWTIWAWLAIGMWSKARLLDGEPDAPIISRSPRRTPGSRRRQRAF